jgi:glycosyltransferase involved in cell wall biosynthesis
MKTPVSVATSHEPEPAPVLVLIPALDESRTLASLLDRVLALHHPCLVTDDGSRDDSARIASAHGATVIRHARRLGKGAALLTGFRFARQHGYRWVVTLDGDGQHDPADIPQLLGAAAGNPRALILGIREKTAAPRIRVGANRVADCFISHLATIPLQDTQSGFRVYPAEAIAAITHRPPRTQGFPFESEVLISLGRQGFPIIGIPVSGHYPADARRSHFRPIRDTLAISAVVLTHWRGSGRCRTRNPPP